jgi:hypothetical protein
MPVQSVLIPEVVCNYYGYNNVHVVTLVVGARRLSACLVEDGRLELNRSREIKVPHILVDDIH